MTAREFINGLPTKVDPAAIDGKNTTFHFDLTGDDGGEVTLLVKDGKMEVLDGFHGEASCKVKASSKNFMKVINKEMNPMMALMMGKVKVSNQGELLKFAKIIGMM